MWNRREENIAFKNQMPGDGPGRSQLSLAEEMKFQPSIGGHDKLFMTETPRQRKEGDLNEGNNISDDFSSIYGGNLRGNLGNVPKETNPQHYIGKFQAANTQGDSQEILMAQNLEFAKPNVAWPQYGAHQFSDASNFSAGVQSSHVNFQKSAIENLKPFMAHHKPSPIDNASVGQIPQLPDSGNFTYRLASQAGSSKYLPYSDEGGGFQEMVQTDFSSNGGISLGHRNHILPSSSSFTPMITSYENLTSPQVRMGKNEMLGYRQNLDEGNVAQNFSYTGTASEVSKGSQNMTLKGNTDISSNTRSTQSSTVSERNEAYGSYQYPKIDTKSTGYPWGDTLCANLCDTDDNKHELVIPKGPSDCEESSAGYGGEKATSNASGEFRATILKKPDGSESDDMNHSVKEESLPEKIDNPNKRPDELCGGPSCLNLDGLNKQLPRKVASVIPEKLWDGTIQLNTSTTVSVVAVFKSGEKASEISWSKHVEVKGKVRLEAFEKYIQELPRSRNRALMVISLCWKAGSSDTGLTGMKEVAKGYQEGQRVGYAQLSPGFDLYVCPHSDPIITILAKYGYFKGMAAVDGDWDSLIGCVIWRRNHPLSNNITKSSERKKVPSLEPSLDSPSGSTISQNPEMNSPLNITLDSECNQAMPGTREPAVVSSPLKASTLDGAKFIMGDKNTPSINDPLNASSVKTNTATYSTPLVPYNPSIIPAQQNSAQKFGVSSSQDSTRCLTNAELPFKQNTEFKKPNIGAGPSPPTFSQSPQMLINAIRSSDDLGDDDDLPEFDFGNVCGAQKPGDHKFPWPNCSTSSSNDPSCIKQPPIEGGRNGGVAVDLALPSERPTNLAQRPHLPYFFGSASDMNQGVVSPKRIEEHTHGGHTAIQTTEPSSGLGTVKTDNSSSSQDTNSFSLKKRHVWDDDDDMPEWCPPNMLCEDLPPLPPPPPLLSLPPPPPLQSLHPPLPLHPLPPLRPLQQLAPTPRSQPLSPPPLPRPRAPPTLSPLPPAMSRPPFPSSLTPTAPPQRPLPPYNQKSSHELQPGLLGQQPVNSNPRLSMHTRPVSRFDRVNRRPSPEPEPKEEKRHRRSGWDVKPWEVKPDPWHVGQRRERF